jgi:hypothetical protein
MTSIVLHRQGRSSYTGQLLASPALCQCSNVSSTVKPKCFVQSEALVSCRNSTHCMSSRWRRHRQHRQRLAWLLDTPGEPSPTASSQGTGSVHSVNAMPNAKTSLFRRLNLQSCSVFGHDHHHEAQNGQAHQPRHCTIVRAAPPSQSTPGTFSLDRCGLKLWSALR